MSKNLIKNPHLFSKNPLPEKKWSIIDKEVMRHSHPRWLKRILYDLKS
jgi:hypothetical protein